MDGRCINHRRAGARLQHPVAYLTAKLSAPVEGKPATLRDEVITIFHEFGHGLHQLLTQVDVPGVSGIQGVEWDAVELPSQIMENFCWEWIVPSLMTAHVDTGAALPRELFDKLLAAKNFQSGMQTVRQLEFALFDMHLHSVWEPRGDGEWPTPKRYRSGAPRNRGRSSRELRPRRAVVRSYIRRRLRGRLLQLQMGGGAVRRCLQSVRRAGCAFGGGGCPFSGRGAGARRKPAGDGVVRRLPWSSAATRCASAA